MKLRFHVLPALAAIAIIAASPVRSAAQEQFSIDVHDSIKILRGEQVAELKVTITNLSVDDINVTAIRTMNVLPEGTTWYSAMCFGDMCYPPDMDTPPAAHIAAGGTADFKLTVGAEEVGKRNDTVRVAVRFNAGPLSDGFFQEFLVISEATSAAPLETGRSLRIAYPNPARTSAIVPIESGVSAASGVRVQLVDALGRIVADMRDLTPGADGVAVDVSTIADGAYFYRLDANGAISTGRIVVAH
jgi:hypothetical protein